jgi:hypothetical protein
MRKLASLAHEKDRQKPKSSAAAQFDKAVIFRLKCQAVRSLNNLTCSNFEMVKGRKNELIV